jgi:predicted NBD/HSP70 family sugar kinase
MHFVPTVKEKDRAVIMAAVRRFGPISRVGIHDLTRLRPATISLMVRDLLKQGKLQVAGRAENPTGRKQILLRVNVESGLVIGVDFDEEFIDVALMNLSPAIKASVREPIHLSGGVEGLIHQLFSCVHRVIQRPGVEKRKIRGIGVGVTGLVNSQEGSVIMSSTIEFWKQVPLKQLFEREFGFPTVVENNCRTKAVAESILGAGEKAEDMIYLEYGRGIGAGIIVRGKVLLGHRFSAGEFGHTHIQEDGPACKCGSFGCLEAIASIGALEARVRTAVAEGGPSQRLKLAAGDPAKINGWMVLKAGAEGDKLCCGLVDELGRYLGLGLANLVNLFNPSVIVLDYRLESAGQQLLEQIWRTIKIQALSYSSEDLAIRFGKLGLEVGVLGAGLLVTEKIFEVPLLKPPRFMISADAHPLAPSFRSNGEESDVGDPTREGT